MRLDIGVELMMIEVARRMHYNIWKGLPCMQTLQRSLLPLLLNYLHLEEAELH